MHIMENGATIKLDRGKVTRDEYEEYHLMQSSDLQAARQARDSSAAGNDVGSQFREFYSSWMLKNAPSDGKGGGTSAELITTTNRLHYSITRSTVNYSISFRSPLHSVKSIYLSNFRYLPTVPMSAWLTVGFDDGEEFTFNYSNNVGWNDIVSAMDESFESLPADYLIRADRTGADETLDLIGYRRISYGLSPRTSITSSIIYEYNYDTGSTMAELLYLPLIGLYVVGISGKFYLNENYSAIETIPTITMYLGGRQGGRLCDPIFNNGAIVCGSYAYPDVTAGLSTFHFITGADDTLIGLDSDVIFAASYTTQLVAGDPLTGRVTIGGTTNFSSFMYNTIFIKLSESDSTQSIWVGAVTGVASYLLGFTRASFGATSTPAFSTTYVIVTVPGGVTTTFTYLNIDNSRNIFAYSTAWARSGATTSTTFPFRAIDTDFAMSGDIIFLGGATSAVLIGTTVSAGGTMMSIQYSSNGPVAISEDGEYIATCTTNYKLTVRSKIGNGYYTSRSLPTNATFDIRFGKNSGHNMYFTHGNNQFSFLELDGITAISDGVDDVYKVVDINTTASSIFQEQIVYPRRYELIDSNVLVKWFFNYDGLVAAQITTSVVNTLISYLPVYWITATLPRSDPTSTLISMNEVNRCQYVSPASYLFHQRRLAMSAITVGTTGISISMSTTSYLSVGDRILVTGFDSQGLYAGITGSLWNSDRMIIAAGGNTIFVGMSSLALSGGMPTGQHFTIGFYSRPDMGIFVFPLLYAADLPYNYFGGSDIYLDQNLYGGGITAQLAVQIGSTYSESTQDNAFVPRMLKFDVVDELIHHDRHDHTAAIVYAGATETLLYTIPMVYSNQLPSIREIRVNLDDFEENGDDGVTRIAHSYDMDIVVMEKRLVDSQYVSRSNLIDVRDRVVRLTT